MIRRKERQGAIYDSWLPLTIDGCRMVPACRHLVHRLKSCDGGWRGDRVAVAKAQLSILIGTECKHLPAINGIDAS